MMRQNVTVMASHIHNCCCTGVSNYEIHHLEELSLSSRVKPQVNQILYNPLVADRQFDLVSSGLDFDM